MKLTQAHLHFYREQKTPTPCWAYRMAKERKYLWSPTLPRTSVNELINSQVPKLDRRLDAQNLCHLITNAAKLYTAPRRDPVSPQYYNLKAYLHHLAFTRNNKRRAGYARKWYWKLFGIKPACECLMCPVCQSQCICAKCGICSRCHQHRPGCAGCQGEG